MSKLLLSSVVALSALTGVAQAQDVAPNCIAFVPEGANGSVAICFSRYTEGNQRALDEMKARDEVQAARNTRMHAECGDAGFFGVPETPASKACHARIKRELPFPPASPATLAFLAHHGLSWGE